MLFNSLVATARSQQFCLWKLFITSTCGCILGCHHAFDQCFNAIHCILTRERLNTKWNILDSLSGWLNASATENICRSAIHFQLYNISSDESGIYLTWDRPNCLVPLHNYVVSLTNCHALSNPNSTPREFDSSKNNSIKIPSGVLTEDNLFSVKAFDVNGGCCATSGPSYLQTSAQTEGI